MPTPDWTQQELFILAFDHRSSFTTGILGIKDRPPTNTERDAVKNAKQIIYQGYTQALRQGAPKNNAGILVDEEYGSQILQTARKEGQIFAMPVEKSGQDEFDLEYGPDTQKHIEEYDPTFVKVLVRYNPEADKEMNTRQLKRLRTLDRYLKTSNRSLLFELLVPPTKLQLAALADRRRYDTEQRPHLMLTAMTQIQDAGVEPTVWKLEGVEKKEEALHLAAQARRGGRRASVVTLGRGESKQMVQKWVEVGAQTPGVNGFAVGRTIWWDALTNYRARKISREQAAKVVAQNYLELINLWNNKKSLR